MAVSVLDSARAARYARESGDDAAADLLDQLSVRKRTRDQEMARFASNCDRYDNLYYPNTSTDGGPSHWADHESARIKGRVHISVNAFPTYVDVPASLQAIEPIENILPLGVEQDKRELAAAVERVYFAWKDEVSFEHKAHRACVVKGLYGRTAAKVWWDEENDRPEVTIIDQPRNLWLGWSSTDYTRLDWALYAYRMSPEAVMEEYGLDVGPKQEKDGKTFPFVSRITSAVQGMSADHRLRGETSRSWLHDRDYMVEVYDYWYRLPVDGQRVEVGTRVKFETWNAIFVGNVMVKNDKHPEYEGTMPYRVLFNGYLPGVPDGRSEFYDIEQLLREKDERLSLGGQMVTQALLGQYWQLVGQEAPDTLPSNLSKLTPNKLHTPGAGNRIEAIAPWMPEFQLEAYLARIDRELVDVSGLNDLLRGMAPATVMGSSKAINMLVANYETRSKMRRDLLYRWRREVWELAAQVWGNKNKGIKAIFETAGRLDIEAPSLTPRDDMETATMATNLLNAKVWSQKRAMDRTGVEDPEAEADLIREERTDASTFPADVLTMTSLMAAIQNLGIQRQQMQGAGGGPASPTPEQAMDAERQMLGGMSGMPSMNGPEEQQQLPPEGMPPLGAGENFLSQTAITDEGASPRLLMQTPLAPEEEA